MRKQRRVKEREKKLREKNNPRKVVQKEPRKNTKTYGGEWKAQGRGPSLRRLLGWRL